MGMKQILVMMLLVALVGCGKKDSSGNVVGEYQTKTFFGTMKSVIHENGVVRDYMNGKLKDEGKWSIVNGELHLVYEAGSEVGGGGDAVTQICKIKSDGSYAVIAQIDKSGKRTEISGNDVVYKKIK